MAKPITIPFAMQQGNDGVSQNSQETLINMYAEVEVSGRAQIVRRQRPGLNRVLENTAEKRCIERFNALHYMILDAGFYSFNGTTLTHLGDLQSFAGRCTMIFNDNGQIMISDGVTGYWWNGTVLDIVATPTTVGYLTYLGGFGIYNNPDTGQFYITASEDFSSVDSLDFATAESSPDNLVRCFVDHNQLYLLGERTGEVWDLSGGADFPFSASPNAQFERGCAAALSVAAEDNTLFFIGDDKLVYRLEGYRPTVISTRPVEYAIAGVSAGALSNAYSIVSTVSGQKVLTITFPGEMTLQYNITNGLWNRAKTFGLDYWRVIGGAGHPTDYYLTAGGICTLIAGLSTDEGGIMRREGISAPGWSEGQQISIYELFLDAEVGRSDINSDAEVMLRVALDGETFGDIRVRSLGPTGDYRRRATWRQLGQGRKPVLELSMTDPTEFSIMGTLVNLEVSTN